MDKRLLKSAEMAASIFDLDPCLIYSREVFHRELHEALETARAESAQSIRTLKRISLKNLSAIKEVGQLRNLPEFSQKAFVLLLVQHIQSQRKELARQIRQEYEECLHQTQKNRPPQQKRRPLLPAAIQALFAKEVAAARYIAREKL